MAHHLAQINVAHIVHPMDGPEMSDFVGALDGINRLAERSDGFVWRLVGDGGADATAVRFDGVDNLLINLSLWRDRESLHRFVYASAHAGVMARKAKWFPEMRRPHMAMWWIPAGQIPDLKDAAMRLDLLAQCGPTPAAFTFTSAFDAAGEALPALAPLSLDLSVSTRHGA